MVLSISCISITKAAAITLASLSQPSAPRRSTKMAAPKVKSQQHHHQNQPSVSEIERAIGAGIYRDHDPASEGAENKSVYDVVLSKSIGRTEGPTERSLRETGEWISGQTERAARSSSKKILEIMFLWIAPAWFLLFLVAIGALKLPFSFLDDLIM